MKKAIFLFSLLVTTLIHSQNYSTAFGIKSGFPGYGSLNIKKFYSSNGAFDLLLGSNFSGSSRYFSAQCLFEYNKNIINMSGFNWYYGAGPTVGFWTTGGYYNKKNDKTYTGMWLSGDGIVGIEYTVSSIPLNIALEGGLSLNVMPYIRLNPISNIALRFAIQ